VKSLMEVRNLDGDLVIGVSEAFSAFPFLFSILNIEKKLPESVLYRSSSWVNVKHFIGDDRIRYYYVSNGACIKVVPSEKRIRTDSSGEHKVIYRGKTIEDAVGGVVPDFVIKYFDNKILIYDLWVKK
jgi:hypothetical protein